MLIVSFQTKDDGDKMRERVELLTSSVEQQKDEITQLSTLYKTERDATMALQKALSSEKENFNRYSSTPFLTWEVLSG